MPDIQNPNDFLQKGSRAADAYLWDDAIAAYSAGLESAALTPEMAYSLFERREYCYNRIGRYDLAAHDAARMADLARESGNEEGFLEARIRQAIALSYSQPDTAAEIANDILSRSKQAGRDHFEARSYYCLGLVQLARGEYQKAVGFFHEARQRFSRAGNQELEARCLLQLIFCSTYLGQDPFAFVDDAKRLVHLDGDLRLEGTLYRHLAFIHEHQPTLSRDYREKALEIFLRIDERYEIASTLHTQGIEYARLGLFKRSYRLMQQALDLVAEWKLARSNHLTALLSNLYGYFAGEEPEAMLDRNLQVITAAEQAKEKREASFARLVHGSILYYEGRQAEASEWLQQSVEDMPYFPRYLPLTLATRARIQLEAGQVETALETSNEAVDRASEQSDTDAFHIVLFTHYQVVRAAAGSLPLANDEHWHLLDQVAADILDRWKGQNDPGLRRNHLSRAIGVPEVLLEWVFQAYHRQESLARLSHQGTAKSDIRDPFKRLVEFGNRITALRKLDTLPEFIMEEFIELCGAERAFISLNDSKNGIPIILQAFGLEGEEAETVRADFAPDFETAARARQPVLRTGVGSVPENEPPPLHQRSLLILPLVQANESLGVIYADTREVFGPFTRAEAELLGVFANQAAAALENARWSEGLEAQVAERTQELSQRNAEMAIVNKIQQGLASRLDISEIHELVGEELSRVFSADVVIGIYDPQTDIASAPYVTQSGKRLDIAPLKIDGRGFIGSMVKNPHTIVINEEIEAVSEKFNSSIVEGAARPKSLIYVPLLKNNHLCGLLGLVDMENEHAFSESKVRLLETIADSMSVALENAHLFEETQRQNAELGIITAVQEALAAEMTFEGIFFAVGEKLREIFDTQTVTVSISDFSAREITNVYTYEKGQHFEPFSRPFNSLYLDVQEKNRTVVFNGNFPEYARSFDDYIVPKGELPRSLVVVPIKGLNLPNKLVLLGLEDQDGLRLFSDSDVRLLETLANAMSVSLENARLFEESQQRNSELSIINSIQQGLAAELDFQAIVDLVGNRLREVFETNNMGIFWYEEKANLLQYLYAYEHGERLTLDPLPPKEGGILDQIVKQRTPIVLNNPEDYKRANYQTMPGTDMSKSLAAVPMISGDRVVGLISIESFEREYAFDESAVRVLNTIAASLGTALQNARFFSETQRLLKETEERNAELAIINSVQHGLSTKLEMQAIIEMVGRKVGEIFKALFVYIALYDRETDQIEYPFVFDFQKDQSFPQDARPLGPGATAHMIASRQPLMINEDFDAQMAAMGSQPFPGGEFDARALLGAPLLAGDEAVGTVVLIRRQAEGPFNPSDLRLLQTLSSAMSVALENARLFNEIQRLLKETEERNAELAVINSIQEGLVEKLDIQAIYDLVGDKVQEIFDADIVMIRSFDHNTGKHHDLYTIENGVRHYYEPEPFSDLDEYFILSRKPLSMPDRVHERMIETFGRPPIIPAGELPKSTFTIPMLVGDKVIGVLSLQNLTREHAFSEGDMRLLQTLANSMSVALENAHLFDETQRLLGETEKRNAELAVINSVQVALASKLDIHEIYDHVGDKVRDIFHADTTFIAFHNQDRSTVMATYYADRTNKNAFSRPYGGGIYEYVVETEKPLRLGSADEHRNAGARYRVPSPGSEKDLNESSLCVPITAGPNVIGAVSVQSYKQNAFSESDLNLLATMTNALSVTLENARLFDETNRLLTETEQRNAELAIINSVQAALAEQLDIQGIYDTVGDKLVEILNADAIVVQTFEQETGLNHLRYNFEKGKRYYTDPVPFSKFHLSLMELTGPLVVNENAGEILGRMGAVHISGTEEAHSAVYVPLMSGSRVFGSISLQNVRPDQPFSEEEVRLLSTLSNSMSVALDNARLFAETEQRNAELAVINSVQQGLAERNEFNKIIELVGEKIREVFDAQGVGISLYDEATGILETPYGVDYGQKVDVPPLPLTTGFSAHVIKNQEPILVNKNIEKSMQEFGSSWVALNNGETHHAKACLFVPILVAGRSTGCISLFNYERENAYTPTDVNLLSTLASSLGVSINNARLFEETKRRANEMAALTEIGRDISATLDLSTVLESITHHARDLLAVSDSAVFLREQEGGDSMRATVALGPIAAQLQASKITRGKGILGHVWEKKKAEIINDAATDPRAITIEGTETPHDERMMAVPLLAGDRVTGMMAVWRNGALFEGEELQFLEGLAQQAATSIENARLFEEVERQRQYSEALVANSPVAIVTTDLQGNIVSWNPAAVTLFGYAQSEAVGKNLDTLIASGDTIEDAARITSRVTTEMRISTVTRRHRKDGRLIDVELLALPVLLHGEPVGAIAIYHDISELLLARKEAESANEAKSAFLATMSHEIRTPMNAIIGMSGLLLDTPLNNEQQEFAEVIRSSGDALLSIINDILDFSKIEAGRMELEDAPFDLRDVLESSLDLIRLPVSQKGLDLAYQMADGVPQALRGDVTRLRQVLINLLNNAVKFTEHGEIVISVRSAPCDEKTGQTAARRPAHVCLHFSVRDTGIGIPPDRANRLFQAFSQVDASTSRRYGGTGLGLAISKSLVELMGGKMWVESEEGAGSTFHFTIRTEAAPEFESRSRLSGEQPALSGKHLLIVDDNATNRRILALQTRTWGMQARETASPVQALSWLESGDPFDLAIIDMHMPEMDGTKLAEEIRALDHRKTLPLILFSSLSGRELKLEKSPFNDHLVKPLKQSQLYDTLLNIFGAGDELENIPDRKSIDSEMAERLPLRILLAEDNTVNQKVALRILERMGYRADVAANGLEALEAVQRQPYDVVLMDVQMPEMDGLEATRRIRERDPAGFEGTENQASQDERSVSRDSDLPGPRIIAMTANATEEDRRMCLEAGMDDYVSKPVRIEELAAALQRTKI